MKYLGKCLDCKALLFWSEEEEKMMREHPSPDPECLCEHVRKICKIEEQGSWPRFDQGIKLKDEKNIEEEPK